MRVAVLGAGYAGLVVARRLEETLDAAVELVVVDESGEHLVQHELHRAVRRPELVDQLRVELEAVLDRATVRTATVEGVDRDRRVVELADGELSYDVAAVCLGAETADHGIEGVEGHGTPLKRVEHARTIRADFEAVPDDGGRAVVGGAGLSGVQVAGELAELANGTDTEVHLLERLETVAPGFPERFRAAVREELEARGVAVRTDTTVEEVTANVVHTDTGSLDWDQLVWTGGIRGPAALDGARPEVRPTLAVDERTFVVGDAGRVVDAEGRRVPASAQAAVREGRVAARNVHEVVESLEDGSPPRFEQFTFDSPGWVVSVGDGAVASVGPLVLRGRAARALKSGAGAGYLASAGAPGGALALLREEL